MFTTERTETNLSAIFAACSQSENWQPEWLIICYDLEPH
jgi:hypothetical protein